MSLKQQISQKIEDHEEELQEAQDNFGGVYIATIEEDTGFNLEVEIDSGTIAFSLRVELGEFKEGLTPQEAYDQLKDHLEENDITVFEDYDEWEEAMS